jgi:hypothetical protein
MAFPILDPTTPVGTQRPGVLDDELRLLKSNLIEILGKISGYPNNIGLVGTTWTNATKPTTNLVNGLEGYNSDLGYTEYYDSATSTWKQKTVKATHDHSTASEIKIPTAGIADGAITLPKIPDGVLTADTTGRAKMANGFVTPEKLSSDVFNSNIAVLTGTVAHGGTIPLPNGFTQEQCKWFVSVNDDNPSGSVWDITESGSYLHYKFQCYASSNRVVTCQAYHEYSGWVAGVANYMIIGIK